MAEQNKNAIREIPKHDIHVKASTQNRSLVKELLKEAYKEEIVPRSRNMIRDTSDSIFDMIMSAIKNLRDGILYPDGNVPAKRSSNTGTYTSNVNYTSYSRPIGQYQPSQQMSGRDTIGQRSGNEVKYVWVESEEKAKQIVGALKEDIDNYGKAKVASLYEMIGERTTFADFNYGWTDPNSIGYYYDTSRRGDEYRWFIDLPRPVYTSNI